MRVLSIVGLLALLVVSFAILVHVNAVPLTAKVAAQAEATHEATRDRPYRSYPAPTGYPGCRYGTDVQTPEAATPIPTRIHP